MLQLFDRREAVVGNRPKARSFVRRREHRTRAARRIVKYLAKQQLLFPGGSHVNLHGRQPEAGGALLQYFEDQASERDDLSAGITADLRCGRPGWRTVGHGIRPASKRCLWLRNTPGPPPAEPGRLAFEQPTHIVRKARRR